MQFINTIFFLGFEVLWRYLLLDLRKVFFNYLILSVCLSKCCLQHDILESWKRVFQVSHCYSFPQLTVHPKLSIVALSKDPLPCFGDHRTHVKSCRITLAGLNGTSTFLCCITFQLRIFSTSPFFTRNSSQLRIAASRRIRMENGRWAVWVRGKKKTQFLP